MQLQSEILFAVALRCDTAPWLKVLRLCFVPLDDDFDEQNAEAQLRGSACKNISAPALASIRRGGRGLARKAGKYPGDGTSAFLRGRPRGTQQPRRRSDFFSHTGHFSEG